MMYSVVMDKHCIVCKLEVEETGYCLHESGGLHHLKCPVDIDNDGFISPHIDVVDG